MLFPSQTPPGRWVYFQKETRLWMMGEDRDDLTTQILNHRHYKSLPRTERHEVSEDIERQVCERLGPDLCQAEPGEDWKPLKDIGRNISLDQVRAFSSFALAHFKNGGALVPVELAKARAQKCLDCQFNQQITNCGACEKVYELVEKMVPAERRMDGLSVCRICGCGLKVKVNVPIEVIRASEEGRNLQYPPADKCWIAAELSP